MSGVVVAVEVEGFTPDELASITAAADEAAAAALRCVWERHGEHASDAASAVRDFGPVVGLAPPPLPPETVLERLALRAVFAASTSGGLLCWLVAGAWLVAR